LHETVSVGVAEGVALPADCAQRMLALIWARRTIT
jgi:hypothetical protein